MSVYVFADLSVPNVCEQPTNDNLAQISTAARVRSTPRGWRSVVVHDVDSRVRNEARELE